MGFSDVIFPLFLFIVGLSIPLAIGVRQKKGESQLQILGHILIRTLALLVMGVYMVNFENIYDGAMPLNKYVWEILMAMGIILIWLDFKRLPGVTTSRQWMIRGAGILLLAGLAIIYRGGDAENIIWMRTYWWGILGLIGWAYLLNSLIFLFFGKRIWVLLLSFLFLSFMNVQESGFFEGLPSFKLVVGASNHALVAAGVLWVS